MPGDDIDWDDEDDEDTVVFGESDSDVDDNDIDVVDPGHEDDELEDEYELFDPEE